MAARQSPRVTRFPTFFVAVALASAGFVAACDKAPSPQGLKEWTPADHDPELGRASAPGNANQGPRGDGGSALATVVEVTWQNQCSTCHGMQGHGDGPQGPMFKAPDLSREDFQSRVKDDEIASTITNGKGRMPKFEIPDEVVRGLVLRVRSFRGR
ncbi:c-type cytochrome [Labilithrix luteola]|uniref:c-type cytochrome n=1 Tax=Labilithrix luteola TaxID=1391654 RepID=UPI0011BABE19|nr:cytochrome c [Labilithrix luteola]